MTDTRDRLIVALDVPTLEDAVAVCDRLPDVRFWKVGLELFTGVGPAIVAHLKARGKRVFLDLKLHDIPNTVAGACRAAARHEVDFLTVHAAGGRAMLQAAREAVAGSATQLLGVTLLTSISPRDLAVDLHVSLELPEYVLHAARLAENCGLAGIVCSPQEVADLRSRLDPPFALVTPGIRPVGAEKGDQQRTATPQQALAAGADYLVIGRPILAALDPQAAWDRLVAALADR